MKIGIYVGTINYAEGHFPEVDQPDVTRALTAQVPGSVHLDLLRAGLIGC
jgi:hypothetical protein